MLSKAIFLLFGFFILDCLAVDPPPGLRPAKAIGDTETSTPSNSDRKVLPIAEEPIPPVNARIPPNLSLRSRMIAAQNSATAASHDEEPQEVDCLFDHYEINLARNCGI